MLKILERLLEALRLVVKIAAVLLFSYMIFAILAQVVGRYLADFIDISITWTEESARFAQIWMILLGAGIAMQYKMHVGVDIITQWLPVMARRVVLVITSLCCLGFLYVAASSSFNLIAIGHIQTSSALGLPMWVVYWAMPIGLSYFGLEFIVGVLKSLRDAGKEE